jgi:hypothetical protein
MRIRVDYWSSVPTGGPWTKRNSTNCCLGRLTNDQLALDQFVQVAGLMVVLGELLMLSNAAQGRRPTTLGSWNQAMGRKGLAASVLAEPVARSGLAT